MSSRIRACATAIVAVVAISLVTAATPVSAAVKVKPVQTGLNGPSAFTFAPNGRIWYLERGTGEVHTLDPSTGSDRLVRTIGGVDGSGERGALGIALHPRWTRTHLVYVFVTRMHAGRLQNQIVRFRTNRPGLRILLATPASASPYHNGGRILFGPGGKLFVMIGEGHNPANAQDRTNNLRGKILRLDPDGSAAAGNLFGRIWSYGHRNSFGFTFDPATNRLFETENGPACTDEINLVVKGANYGWGPKQTCSKPKPRGTNNSGPRPRHLPKWYFGSTIGITGATFCDRCALGGPVGGDLVFGDVNTGTIRAIDLNTARSGFSGPPRTLASAPTGVHSVEVSPRGRIFVSGPTGIYRLVRR